MTAEGVYDAWAVDELLAVSDVQFVSYSEIIDLRMQAGRPHRTRRRRFRLV